MTSTGTSSPPLDMHQTLDRNDHTMPETREAFMRVDDLEGHLRGLILKNSSPLKGNAVDSTMSTNSSPSSQKAAEAPFPDARDRGQASQPGEHEASRGRGRRPNQAQRRQMKKVDIQVPALTPQKESRQTNGQLQAPRVDHPQQRQTRNAPHFSNMSTQPQAPKPYYLEPDPDQRYNANQQQEIPKRSAILLPPHQQQLQPQHTRLTRGFVPNAGLQHPGPVNPYPGVPPPNNGNRLMIPHHPSMIPHTRPQPGQYMRPNVPNRQLYQADRPHASYQQRPNWGPHSDIAAQNVFMHAIGEAVYTRAKIPFEEFREKEDLRLVLEQICAEAVSKMERERDSEFDPKTISLACFGSLRSGFATCGSDMDLALVSPASCPDPASPESEIPRLLEKVLLNLGYGARLLTKTRVPIIRFCEKPTPELVEALHENRAKWEKERDAPPKPKKAMEVVTKKKFTAGDGGTSVETEKNGVPQVEETQPNQSPTTITPPTTDLANGNPQNLANTGNDTRLPDGQVKTSEMSVMSRTDDELVYLYKLAIKEGWFEHSERVIIVKFIEAVRLHGADGDHENLVGLRHQLYDLPDVLSRYRVPPESHLDYPKTGVGIQCDINFSNHLALHNTRLLKCYSLCDPRVQPMIIVIKAWTKARKINSSYHGTLSSYGYVLMALHYLMNIVWPPVIPNLQLVSQASSPQDNYGLNGYNVRFWQSEEEIIEAARRGQLTSNRTDTEGSLLRGFFHYYAHPHTGGFSWASDVISLRTPGGILRKEDKGWTGAKTVTLESTIPGEDAKEVRHRYLFAIEDPFELEHNVARTVVHNGIVAIRDEFRRAAKIIQARGMTAADGDLFAEAASKENLQRKFFGPLVRPFGPGVYKKKEDAGPKQQHKGQKDDTKYGIPGDGTGVGHGTTVGEASSVVEVPATDKEGARMDIEEPSTDHDAELTVPSEETLAPVSSSVSAMPKNAAEEGSVAPSDEASTPLSPSMEADETEDAGPSILTEGISTPNTDPSSFLAEEPINVAQSVVHDELGDLKQEQHAD